MNERILIIGPSPENENIGGVQKHINNLKKLELFRDARIYDPGSIHSNVKKSLLSIISNILTLRRIVSEIKYDVIFINTSISLSPLIKLLLILNIIPKIEKYQTHVFFHGGRFANIKIIRYRTVRTILDWFFKPKITYHFLCSEQMDGFNKYFKGYQTKLYSNYSDEKHTLKRIQNDSMPLKLLYAGRIIKNKGIFELLEAYKCLCINGYNNIELTFVGDGPDFQELRNKAEKMEINNLRFMGYLKGIELENEYLRADIMVFPTYSEGFPYTMIESFRAGLPIIATPTGALNDFIIDGVTGFKIKPKDHKSIIEMIKKCMENRKLLKTMSDNCYNIFINMLAKENAEKYYYNLLYN